VANERATARLTIVTPFGEEVPLPKGLASEGDASDMVRFKFITENKTERIVMFRRGEFSKLLAHPNNYDVAVEAALYIEE
jgi:hypothetical protein